MSHSGEGSVSHAVVVAVLCSVLSDSLRPHALQPARLLRPWDSSRQEYWSGLPFPSPGDLSDPGLEPKSLCLLGCRWILYYCTTWKAPLVSGGQIRGARGVWRYLREQGSANYGLQDNTGSLPAFINKALWAQSHTHSFTYCLLPAPPTFL